MKIAVRVDSSNIIGTGHVMRCLSLVNQLTTMHSASAHFFCRNNVGAILDAIAKRRHSVQKMLKGRSTVEGLGLAHGAWLGASQTEDAQEFLSLVGKELFDLLIVDHYGIDRRWEKLVRDSDCFRRVLVIDDLVDREHQCDFLLDQTYDRTEDEYRPLVNEACELLLGSDYCLLRPEFAVPLKKIESCRNGVDFNNLKVLVMFGGTDPENLTGRVIEVLLKQNWIKSVDVVLGSSAEHKGKIQALCARDKMFKLHVGSNSVAEIMLDNDLAIGAAGVTSWERAAMGLPSLVIVQAENQKMIANKLNDAGIIQLINQADLTQQLNLCRERWLPNQIAYNQVVRRCVNICDGKGTERVCRILNKQPAEIIF